MSKNLTQMCADIIAEKDKVIENWQTMYQSVMQGCHNGIKEDKRLREQLAEKERKIETLKQRIDSIVKIYSNDFVSKDTELKELRYKVKQHNQDKISFCIEKLTDVRSFVRDATEIKEPDYTKVCNYVEKQIEKLKKGVE